MVSEDIKKLLLAFGQAPIAFHRTYAAIELNGKKIGVTSGLFLSQVMYWTSILTPDRDGWFYKTAKDWEEETELTEKEQRSARTKLKELGILEEKLKKAEGNPTIHFKVNLEKLAQYLVSAKTPKRNCQKGETYTENTTEITKDINSNSPKRAKNGEGKYEKPVWGYDKDGVKNMKLFPKKTESDLVILDYSVIDTPSSKKGEKFNVLVHNLENGIATGPALYPVPVDKDIVDSLVPDITLSQTNFEKEELSRTVMVSGK